VHFAVDDQRVRFCTELKSKSSWFLPFDQGAALLEEIAPEHLWADVLDEARRQILGEDVRGSDEAPRELD
jgi:hypothetical protein